MENEKISQENYLAKNLRRVVLISGILIVVLAALYILEARFNFLDGLARVIMAKLMGR